MLASFLPSFFLSFITLWCCCPLHRTPVSNFVRMYTHRLIQTKDHSPWSENKTIVQAKSWVNTTQVHLAQSFPIVVGKTYEHQVQRCIQLPTDSYTTNSLLTALVNCKTRMVSSQFIFLCCIWSVVMWSKIQKLVSQTLVKGIGWPFIRL